MKAWLKGGLIGGIIGILLYGLMMLFGFGRVYGVFNILQIPYRIMYSFFKAMNFWWLYRTLGEGLITIILYTILFFIIGALMGRIVGKLKK